MKSSARAFRWKTSISHKNRPASRSVFYSFTGTKFPMTMELGVTAQSTANISTPPAFASRRAFPKAGSVASFAVKYCTGAIWITNSTAASKPC